MIQIIVFNSTLKKMGRFFFFEKMRRLREVMKEREITLLVPLDTQTLYFQVVEFALSQTSEYRSRIDCWKLIPSCLILWGL